MNYEQKYINAGRLRARIENLKIKVCGSKATESDITAALASLDLVIRIIDSLQQEPIEKDEETEKLIVCDIIEATIERINGGKKDEEKEENIMREKIAYLRDLGLKAK